MPLLTFHQIVDGAVMNIWRYIILYQLISVKILMEFFLFYLQNGNKEILSQPW